MTADPVTTAPVTRDPVTTDLRPRRAGRPGDQARVRRSAA
ncbi:hypothetical protein FB380_004188 [Modestobacter marinus]|uniref:Uncharacterized protein n=1 Tax=Modestobacter marinus TaxID=477641 RepID=A0A846M5E5_9ACTN|nr:hypothetical protein [Modestobacter marinus]